MSTTEVVQPTEPLISVQWREIDQRVALGMNAVITWDWDPASGLHRVRVADEGGLVKAFRWLTGGEARERFNHPFAS